MYQLFGMEVSPYSVKVRAQLRYKNIAHQWRLRNRENEADFQAHARLPIIPLLICPDGKALQDSTPIMMHIEDVHPEASLIVPDAALNFLSLAIEEAADEWLLKAMFHYRWNYEADRIDSSMRLAKASVPEGKDPTNYANAIAAHLMTRREPLGCTADNATAIEAWLPLVSTPLNAHLMQHRYLFGDHMSLGDLGLASMYYELFSDPTPRQRLSEFNAIAQWLTHCMDCSHRDDGQFASWDDLAETLLPFLQAFLVDQYLPWATANQAALASNGTLSVHISGYDFQQPAQKYPAKTWQALKQQWQALPSEAKAQINSGLPGASVFLG